MSDRNILGKMLNRMLGTSGDGQHDHLMDFTCPGRTFLPPLEVLSQG